MYNQQPDPGAFCQGGSTTISVEPKRVRSAWGPNARLERGALAELLAVDHDIVSSAGKLPQLFRSSGTGPV